MKKRKQFWSVMVVMTVMLALVTIGCSINQPASKAEQAEGKVIVKVLDVGQGDAVLLRSGGQITLIDTGDTESREKVVSYLKKEGVSVIDHLIITHPHNDHIGGVAAVFEHFTIKQIYDSGQTTTTNTYRKYLETVQKKKIPFALLAAGSHVDVGSGAVLQILAPEEPFFKEDNGQSDLNNNAIVAKLIYGSFSMLLTSDAEKASEARMVKKYSDQLKSTVLKVGHHGSTTSSTSAFLKAVAPEVAVITVGAGNDYGHPHEAVVKRYQDRKIKMYRSDQHGTITISSDGTTWAVVTEKGR